MSNANEPAMPIQIVDCRCLDDIIVIDYNEQHDDIEITVAYDNGNDSEMTCFVSKNDAIKLAKSILSQLQESNDE